MALAKTADMTVLLTIAGDSIGRPGTEWYERVREALWEAIDECEVFVTDNDGEDVGPYSLTVTSISPSTVPRAT